MDGVAGASEDTEDLLKHYGKVGMYREQVVTEGRISKINTVSKILLESGIKGLGPLCFLK